MNRHSPADTPRQISPSDRTAPALSVSFLRGQLAAFLTVSLYVKTVEVFLTPPYSPGKLGAGDLFRCCWEILLFNSQELAVWAFLLLSLILWAQIDGFSSKISRIAARLVGWVVLPFLSLVEILGLAHFAYFLTPLGPEEVQTAVWAPMLIASSNVMTMGFVAPGILLLLITYYVLPWLGRWPAFLQGPRSVRGSACATALSLALVVLPKPIVPEALLAPHPILWLVFGNRPKPAWASLSPDDSVASSLTGHNRPQGQRRYEVSERPKNVVVLMLESTRANSTAIYNPKATAGRALLSYRDEMVVFDHFYAPVPTSAHALFSVLYGVYPYMGTFWSASGKSVIADSMAQLFSRTGFTTSFFITSDLRYDDVRSFTEPGFDHVLDVNDWPGQEPYAMLPWGRDDRLLIEEMKRFLASSGDKPFFLLAMTSNPHHPYAAHRIFRDRPEREDLASYEQLVDYDLQLVGELYAWMKSQGVAEDTLLFVLGDHGEAFGEHPGNFGHAAFIHEENLHIPAFLLHPRRLGLPTHISQLGSQVDLRATITDILGVQDNAPGDGMSLLHEDPERYIAHFTEGGLSHFGIRDARFSYIYTPQTESEQLFDWQRDGSTRHNLVKEEPDLVAQYRARLRRWQTRHQMSLAQILR